MTSHEERNTRRWATRSPTGRGERWQLVSLPADDQECARRGWNLCSPTLDVSALSRDQLDALTDAASSASAELPGLLENLPRLTCPGYDVDGDCSIASAEIATRLLRAEASRGNNLRASFSSGPGGAGRHLEFGPATHEAQTPGLLRTMMRRAAVLAAEAGLVPQDGSSGSVDGVPLFWTLPDHKSILGKEAPARLDLSPLNHNPRSRERMFRPLGGLNKRQNDRKSLCRGSPRRGPPITVAVLSEAPAAVVNIAPGSSEQIGARTRRARERNSADRVEIVHASGPLYDWFMAHKRAGAHHDERQAVAAFAIQAALFSKRIWVSAMGQAWGDIEDAGAAWDSTLRRLNAHQPVRGATWLRKRLGTRAWRALVAAISAVSGRSLPFLTQRLGTPTAAEEYVRQVEEYFDQSAADIRAGLRPAISHDRGIVRDRIRTRVLNSEYCCRTIRESRCTNCNLFTCRCKIHCSERELCQLCLNRYMINVESWLAEKWRGLTIRIVHVHGFETREGAMKKIAVLSSVRAGEGALRVVSPATDGTWSLMILCRKGAEIDNRIVFLGAQQVVKSREAIRLLCVELQKRSSTVLDMLERGETEDAVLLMEALYCTHSVMGQRNASLPYPRMSDLDAARKAELAELREEREDFCYDCPEDTRQTHTVTIIATGIIVIEDSDFPPSITQVRESHRRGYFWRDDLPPPLSPPSQAPRVVLRL